MVYNHQKIGKNVHLCAHTINADFDDLIKYYSFLSNWRFVVYLKLFIKS